MEYPSAPNKTTCPYCGVGCGIELFRDEQGQPQVRGDTDHPANFGKLCSKGSTLAHTLVDEGRLLYPMIEGVRASWDHATRYIASAFQRIREQHGPESIAFYVSGQLLTEDYYVANKLMKGFLGSANIDTNSRLCMSSAVAAYKRAFGEDSVPGCYEDLELADLIVLTGSNTAWCHPILFQRIKAAKSLRPEMKVVVIDPRRTASCEIADLHLPLKPGTDVALFNGLLGYLAQQEKLDGEYISRYSDGFHDALTCALGDAPDIDSVALQCDVEREGIATFYNWFAETPRTLTCFSQGINQSSQGTDKGNAIINCHIATGRIGKPGASPFSLTGQPNAMGGREVGGLSNQLAAHREFTSGDLTMVQQFWQATDMAQRPGLKAVELFEAVEHGGVKAVWIMGTNPVVSLPNADQVKRALQKAELVIVSDCIAATDTSAYAHVLLPAAGWGEKDGTVTNSERRISRQRGMLEMAGESRQDWRILTDVACAMGFEHQFPYQTAADVFREHASLTGLDNHGKRQLDISELADLSSEQYDDLKAIQWPVQNGTGRARLYNDGQFSTPNRRAQCVPVHSKAVANPASADWPLALNTGRIRDQWHTMTRTALAPPLTAHKAEPYVEIHPLTAEQFDIESGDYVEVASQWGQVTVKADVTESIRPGELFVPMHWNDQWSRGARIGAVVNPAVDPYSGQPESKHTPCIIQRWQPGWIGFIFARQDLPIPDTRYAAKVRGQGFYRFELASDAPAENWQSLQGQLAPIDSLSTAHGEPLLYQDSKARSFRAAWLDAAGRLSACLYIAPAANETILRADRGWLASLYANDTLSALERKALLSGRSPAGVEDCGRTVCACFGVGENTIRNAIQKHGLKDAAAVGKMLKAGTNCGSCVAEIKGFL